MTRKVVVQREQARVDQTGSAPPDPRTSARTRSAAINRASRTLPSLSSNSPRRVSAHASSGDLARRSFHLLLQRSHLVVGGQAIDALSDHVIAETNDVAQNTFSAPSARRSCPPPNRFSTAGKRSWQVVEVLAIVAAAAGHFPLVRRQLHRLRPRRFPIGQPQRVDLRSPDKYPPCLSWTQCHVKHFAQLFSALAGRPL